MDQEVQATGVEQYKPQQRVSAEVAQRVAGVDSLLTEWSAAPSAKAIDAFGKMMNEDPELAGQAKQQVSDSDLHSLQEAIRSIGEKTQGGTIPKEEMLRAIWGSMLAKGQSAEGDHISKLIASDPMAQANASLRTGDMDWTTFRMQVADMGTSGNLTKGHVALRALDTYLLRPPLNPTAPAPTTSAPTSASGR